MKKERITAERMSAAENLKARQFNTLAARVERGTMTAADAMRRAAELERGTADGITAAYVVNQSVKAAARAAHTLENYSGGVDVFRELAKQAELNVAKLENGAAFPFVSAVSTDGNGGGDTLPDVMDMIQSAAAGIMESGDYMTARGGVPIVDGQRRGENGRRERAARIESYSVTHRPATAAAMAFAHQQRKSAERERGGGVETNGAAIRKAAAENDGAASNGGGYTMEYKATADALEMARKACGGVPFAVDVVNTLVKWDSGAAMPTAAEMARYMLAHMDGLSDSTRKAIERIPAERRARRVAENIRRAYDAISRNGGESLRAALIAAIAEQKRGGVRFIG